MAKRKKLKKEELKKQERMIWIRDIIICIVAIGLGFGGYYLYKLAGASPFEKGKALKTVEKYQKEKKRPPAEVCLDAALLVVQAEREKSPIMIGSEDLDLLQVISEKYRMIGEKTKANWVENLMNYKPKDQVRPQSASLGGNVLNLGGNPSDEKKPTTSFSARADLENIEKSLANNPKQLVILAQEYHRRNRSKDALRVLQTTEDLVTDEMDIFTRKDVVSKMVIELIRLGETQKATEIYIQNNIYLGAGITIDMIKEWVERVEFEPAFNLFQGMIYTPWQTAEALVVFAQGYHEHPDVFLTAEQSEFIDEIIQRAKKKTDE